MSWGFYGRRQELTQLQSVLGRERWFFARIQGRRRIGKTSLIQKALAHTARPVLYVQIPDSAPAGILSAVADAFETFRISPEIARIPTTLAELAKVIETLARAGYVIVLDEFQYFTRKHLAEFPPTSRRRSIA